MKNYIKLLGVVCLFSMTTAYADHSPDHVSNNHSNTTLGNYQGNNSTGEGGFNDEAGSGDVDYNSNNNSTSTTKVESSTSGMYGMAGSATTTNLTTSYGQDLCMGSWTAGASMMGIGVTGGSTISDSNCERLRNVKLLNDLGLKDVALTTLCENRAVRIAMKRSRPAAYNKLCAVWDEHADMDDYLEAKIDDSGETFNPNAEGFNLEESPEIVTELVNKYKVSKHP